MSVFWRGGVNGTNTLLDAILETLGSDYSMQATPELLMETANDQHPTVWADLYGKRFVSAVETEADKRTKEAFAKGFRASLVTFTDACGAKGADATGRNFHHNEILCGAGRKTDREEAATGHN